MKGVPRILLPTCDRYIPVARWTLQMLDRFWPDHPPVDVCGARNISGPFRLLPFHSDPQDWAGIVLEATALLQDEGCVWSYLILDDHAPFGECHTQYLSRDLPAAAEDLDACCVHLMPIDGMQESGAACSQVTRLSLCGQDPTSKWRYSLHPALWRLSALRDVLAMVTSTRRPCTARMFEAISGRPGSVPRWDARTYRVKGRGFTVRPGPLDRPWSRLVHHARRWAARYQGGARRVEAFDESTAHLTRYGSGPYPIFWSGLMRSGLHDAAIRLLEFKGLAAEASAAREAARQTAASNPESPPPAQVPTI